MTYWKGKLFWKMAENKKEIFIVEWEEKNQEYYAFIRQKIEDGYHQISITAEMMLDLITIIAQNNEIYVNKIEMMEENTEVEDELNTLVENCKRNRGILLNLIERLRYLVDESSIEIKRIYFVEKNKENETKIIFLQVNGIIGLSMKGSKLEEILINYVKQAMANTIANTNEITIVEHYARLKTENERRIIKQKKKNNIENFINERRKNDNISRN